MRTNALCILLSGALVMLTACVSPHGPSPELTAALDSSADCGTRFQAAEKISSAPDRDLACSQIALSAVDCRNDQVLLACIDRISDPTLKDGTAYQCAAALAKAGRGIIAATVANDIVNSDTRAKALITINQTAPEKTNNGK